MLEVQDILLEYGDEFIKKHRLTPHIRKVLNNIEACRTAKLGGHIDECEECGNMRISYNSCRDRHCPK